MATAASSDLHEAVLNKEEMTVCQVIGVLQTHDNYIRLMTAINHAGMELYFKVFHGTDDVPNSLGLPSEPDKLYKHLQKYQAEFEELKKRGEITHDDYLTLFPPARKEIFSQEFSFPLFQTILRMFDRAENNSDAQNAEEQLETFLQEMEKLYEIQTDKKLVRKLDNSYEVFEEKWNEVVHILKSVGYDIAKIEALHKDDLEENDKFRFALLRSELNTLLYECDDCSKTIKMNHLALQRLKGNFQSALSESKEDNNNAKTTNELKELGNLLEEIEKSGNKIDVNRQAILDIVPNIKHWREKNTEGDVIVCDENISKLRDEINEQTRRVSDLFNMVSFDIVYLKERAYSVTGEVKNVDTLPRKKSH